MVIKVQGSAYALNSAANLLEVLSLSRLSALEPGDADWIAARGVSRRVQESTCFLRAVSRAAWRGTKPRAGSTSESLGFQLGGISPRTGGAQGIELESRHKRRIGPPFASTPDLPRGQRPRLHC